MLVASSYRKTPKRENFRLRIFQWRIFLDQDKGHTHHLPGRAESLLFYVLAFAGGPLAITDAPG